MKLVAVTQRVEIAAGHGERRDALDQAWTHLLGHCGCLGAVLPNNPTAARALWRRLPFAGLLLTGGNDLAEFGGDASERDETERMLLVEARAGGRPILGVCRGMQVIQAAFGVDLQPVAGHIAERQTIWLGERRVLVNSYHTFGARQTVPELLVWARADDGVIKAVRHTTEPIVGVMWHPERLQPFREADCALLRVHFGGADP